MPSAANLKSEKAASAEASDNSPIRQIVTLIEHKIRNLEKRKSKLTSYRDLQKAGKELNSDQKVAVAKYDEVAQTLEFARELAKNVSSIAISAEREAKKQAKKDAWVRYAADTGKIREVLLILDCLTQMGCSEARDDFLNGTNGAAKLSNEDLNILDNLYPEVTPKHEVNEEGQPGFQNHVTKAAEHLYAIIDGKPKEVLGTTYTHIKEIITVVHESGYFDKVDGGEEAPCEEVVEAPPEPPLFAPLPPAAAVVPAPAYPLCPLPPITLQEVEHAYFAQQYPQQRPISEVIGSQNFFFLQESEIDSPVGTPQPPPVMAQSSPPAPIPSQTFTNQHFVQLTAGRVGVEPLPPPPHFVAPPEHAYPPVMMSAAPPSPAAPPPQPATDAQEEEWNETASPEREEQGDRAKGHGDGAGRFRRYGGRGGRPATNGYRSRGGYGPRAGGEQYHRHNEYRDRPKEYQRGQYEYQPRHKEAYQRPADTYYGNGDSEGRDRHDGYKGRSRGAPRAPRGPRPARAQYTRRDDRE